jgi:polar amino acid transport system substrate-binding protein
MATRTNAPNSILPPLAGGGRRGVATRISFDGGVCSRFPSPTPPPQAGEESSGVVIVVALALVLLLLGAGTATARTLAAIAQRGAIALCAHPNALPFASKNGARPGFQVELGEALAERLGVALERHWVFNSFQYRRADCDIVLDAIADKAAVAEIGLRLSRPYYRGGVALAVRGDSEIASLASLAPERRVGVQVGSLAAMALAKRGVATSPFGFEDEMLDALARREIEGAAVTPATIGWFNTTHDGARLRVLPVFADDPELNWNVAVGMLRPDDRLRERIDAVLDGLLAEGVIARIYARYGIELQPPR